jgi:hypothetical protein
VLAAVVTAVALWSGVAGAATSPSADPTDSVPAAIMSDPTDTAAPAIDVVSDPTDPAATTTSLDTAPKPALLWNGLGDSVIKPSLASLLTPIFGNRWTAVFGSVAGNRWGGSGW